MQLMPHRSPVITLLTSSHQHTVNTCCCYQLGLSSIIWIKR